MRWFKTHLDQIIYGLTTLAVVFPLISIAISQIFLALAILGFLLDRALNPRKPLSFPPFKLPLALFIGTTLVSWIFSPEPEIGFPPINKFWLFVIVFLVANYFSQKRLHIAYQALFFFGLVSAGFALVQYIVPSLGSTQGRLTGFMGHWMTLSGGLMLVFISLAGYTIYAAPKKIVFWLIALSFLGGTLVLTLTRSVWVASLTGLIGAIGLRFPIWKTLLIIGLVGIILIVSIPESVQTRLVSIWDPQDPSNYARLAIWKTGFDMIQKNPWVGVGPQRVSKVFFDYHPDPQAHHRSGFFWIHMHNNLLQFAVERGIPCALAWLWLVMQMGFDHYRGFRQAPVPSLEKSIYAIGFLNVGVLFLAGLFEFNFGDSEVLMVFLFLASSPYVLNSAIQKVIAS